MWRICLAFSFKLRPPWPARSLPEQIALELSQGRKNMENQHARCVTRLDPFCQALEAALLKIGHDL